TISNVELKVNFPHKNKMRPFFVSFQVPGKGYTSNVTFDGLGTGELEEWRRNHYRFTLHGKRLNPRDFERFVQMGNAAGGSGSANLTADSVNLSGKRAFVQPMQGLVDLEASGEGTFDKGIKTKIEANVDQLQVGDPKQGKIDAGKTQSKLTAQVN